MLKSRPSGCRVDLSYVSTLSKGNGTVAVPYLAAFLSQRSVMMTSFKWPSLRRAAAASLCLRIRDRQMRECGQRRCHEQLVLGERHHQQCQ